MRECWISLRQHAWARWLEGRAGVRIIRLDYPVRDDANWLRHTLVTYTPEGPRIDYKPVTITMYKPERREY